MGDDAMNAGVRYSRDRPKSCEFCYYWKGRMEKADTNSLMRMQMMLIRTILTKTTAASRMMNRCKSVGTGFCLGQPPGCPA